MPRKPIKSNIATKSSKKYGKRPRRDNHKTASKNARIGFVAATFVLAAALISVSLGMFGYQKPATNNSTGSVQKQASIAREHRSLSQTPLSQAQLAQGATVVVGLYENSGTEPVNVVQGVVKYPADKLELISVATGDVFRQVAATDAATPGIVRIARSITPGSPSVEGKKLVVSLKFKTLRPTDVASALSVDQAASMVVSSRDSHNVLGRAGTSLELLQ